MTALGRYLAAVILVIATHCSDSVSQVLFTHGGDRIVVGATHSCLLSAGQLACWGKNITGALGTGDTTDRQTPTFVRSASGNWLDVSAGEGFSCAMDSTHALWCWGSNNVGQLGAGDTAMRWAPALAAGDRMDWSIFALGSDHMCAIAMDHSLWCWGHNSENELGQGATNTNVQSTTPLQVGSDHDWIAIALGQGATCGIRMPGQIWCWGRNSYGEIGIGADPAMQARSVSLAQVGTRADWVSIASGWDHVCAIGMGGDLWCWGRNSSAQLGIGDTTDRNAPVQVGAGVVWQSVSASLFETCATTTAHELYCWGRNEEGQVGLGTPSPLVTMPTRVGGDGDWAEVSVGQLHMCARKLGGEVFCTGLNDNGMLGVNDLNRRSTLTLVARTN